MSNCNAPDSTTVFVNVPGYHLVNSDGTAKCTLDIPLPDPVPTDKNNQCTPVKAGWSVNIVSQSCA